MALRHAAASAMLLALLLAAAGLTGAATQQAPEQWRVALPPPPPLQAAHARAAPPAASDPVRYWLYHLQVAVPRYSFKKLGVNFTLSDVVCTQIELGKISSTQSGESYSVAVSGLGVTCAGQWRGTSLLPAEKGTLAIGLGNSSLALGVQLTKDNDGLAIKATAQGVRSGLNVTELAFEGAAKFIEDILHKILPELAKDLTAFLNTEATKLLTSLIDKDVTQLLTGVDDVIRPYLHPGPPPVPPPVPPGTLAEGETSRKNCTVCVAWIMSGPQRCPCTCGRLAPLLFQKLSVPPGVPLGHRLDFRIRHTLPVACFPALSAPAVCSASCAILLLDTLSPTLCLVFSLVLSSLFSRLLLPLVS